MRIMGLWFDSFTFGFLYLVAMMLVFCLCAEMYYDSKHNFSVSTVVLTGMFGSAIFSMWFVYMILAF